MGIILDEVCCVDTNNYIENENYQSSPLKESRGRDSRQNLSMYKDKFYNSSFLRTLPQNEIKLINLKINPQVEFKSLKTVPINTQNIIRRQSGNPLEHDDIIKKLGKGTFGTVYKVMHKITGTIRAMKDGRGHIVFGKMVFFVIYMLDLDIKTLMNAFILLN